MDLLARIDALIDEHHLLRHPFYVKWTAGTLPLASMQEYSRQYFAFESTFPRYLSALHSRSEDPGVRRQLLDNLWDEEHGAANHAELWLRFAEGIGVPRDEVQRARRNDATSALLALYDRTVRDDSIPSGVAAVYAYERQVPEVAGSKIDGLRRHYGVDDAETLAFFKVHGTLDLEHSAAEREMVGQLADGDEDSVLAATRAALIAWQDFLTAVDQPPMS